MSEFLMLRLQLSVSYLIYKNERNTKHCFEENKETNAQKVISELQTIRINQAREWLGRRGIRDM